MNTSKSSGPIGPLLRLWHRFNIWRAMRMYRRLVAMASEAEAMKAKADMLMQKHAEDPQSRLPLGDD
jgi:hypothetical protein